jgi:hypothetical protein
MTTDFDWVRARAQCSVAEVFQKLKLGAKADVDAANSLRNGEPVKFSVIEQGNRFTVSRDHQSEPASSVDFTLEKHIIKIEGVTGKIEAFVTLNDDGECKIKIEMDGEELELWHLRRRCLEGLFWPIRITVTHIGDPRA